MHLHGDKIRLGCRVEEVAILRRKTMGLGRPPPRRSPGQGYPRASALRMPPTKNQETIKAFKDWSLKCQSYEMRHNAIRDTQCEVPITPHELDAGPMLFNCVNGTIDLETGKLRPHRGRDYITRMSPVVYDPNAKCPTFLEAFNAAMADDGDKVAYLRTCSGMPSPG